jgi:acyl-coenzyme A thioesterase PaaI-like protein
VEFKLKFIRPAAHADRFLAVGKVTQQVGTTLTMCQGEIIGEQGSQQVAIAVMQATVSNVRGA